MRAVDLANRRADSLGCLHRKRLELARALATEPSGAAPRRDRRRPHRRRGRRPPGDDPGGAARSDIAIVWIEHIVHVLMQAIDRLVCFDAGRVIADGEPEAVIGDAAVIDAYLGGSRA